MSLNGVLLELEHVAQAALQAQTGVAIPGAPPTSAVIATLAGSKITLSQAVSAAKVFEGSGLGAVFAKAISGKADLEDGYDVTLEIAKGLAELGIPYASELVLALEVGKVAYTAFNLLYAAHPELFQAAPRPGPIIAEADWSHGLPKAQTVTNPSGAIGGGS